MMNNIILDEIDCEPVPPEYRDRPELYRYRRRVGIIGEKMTTKSEDFTDDLQYERWKDNLDPGRHDAASKSYFATDDEWKNWYWKDNVGQCSGQTQSTQTQVRVEYTPPPLPTGIILFFAFSVIFIIILAVSG